MVSKHRPHIGQSRDVQAARGARTTPCWPWSASGVRGGDGSPVSDTQLYAWRESRVVTCDVPGEQPALVVVPTELKQVFVSWQRWALGLETPAFNQVALGVEWGVLGRGFEGKVGLGAAVVGQVTGAPAVEACWVLCWLCGGRALASELRRAR